jgi:twitching motility protein PilT
MKKLQTLLQHLSRPEVVELVIVSDKPVRAKTAAGNEQIGEAVATDAIVALLFSAGGSRHVDDLAERPVQWRTRVEGVGQVMVSAMQRGDIVEARFIAASRPVVQTETGRATVPAPPSPRTEASRAKTTKAMPVRVEIGDDFPEPEVARRSRPPARGQSARPAAQRAQTGRPPRRASGEERVPPAPAVPAAPPPVRVPAPPPVLDVAPAPVGLAPRAPRAAAAGRGTQLDLLRKLVSEARQRGASDVHLVAGRPVLVRALGELMPQGEALAAEAVEDIADAILPMRHADRLDTHGAADFALELDRAGRLRVNVSRQRTGLKIALRLVPPGVPTLAGLGMPMEIADATRHHQGLIVVTGPAGHGKTSTLAAIVDLINESTTHHVITVEDPVEVVHPKKRALISQREVGTHTRSFASALKGSLREDPDVIVVGELRDAETVRMALSASETGHLVLGTMSTPSAARTIDRLVDLFPPSDQQQVRLTLAGGLKLIVSQRLVPTADGSRMVAAAELLPGSVPLWNLIRENKTFQIPSVQQRGRGAGIIRLDDSLVDLIRAGTITLAAARAVAEAPEELEAKVGRAPARPAVPPGAAPPQQGRGLLERAGALLGRRDEKGR